MPDPSEGTTTARPAGVLQRGRQHVQRGGRAAVPRDEQHRAGGVLRHRADLGLPAERDGDDDGHEGQGGAAREHEDEPATGRSQGVEHDQDRAGACPTRATSLIEV